MSVRLPSGPGYAEQVEKEHRWLPGFAGQLPLPIPVPLALGVPGCGFPWPWSVYRWLPGEPAATARLADPVAFAADLAGVPDRAVPDRYRGRPAAGQHSCFRGAPLTVYDGQARQGAEGPRRRDRHRPRGAGVGGGARHDLARPAGLGIRRRGRRQPAGRPGPAERRDRLRAARHGPGGPAAAPARHRASLALGRREFLVRAHPAGARWLPKWARAGSGDALAGPGPARVGAGCRRLWQGHDRIAACLGPRWPIRGPPPPPAAAVSAG